MIIFEQITIVGIHTFIEKNDCVFFYDENSYTIISIQRSALVFSPHSVVYILYYLLLFILIKTI